MACQVACLPSLFDHVRGGLGAQIVEGESLVACIYPFLHQPLDERLEPSGCVRRALLVVNDVHRFDGAWHGHGSVDIAA